MLRVGRVVTEQVLIAQLVGDPKTDHVYARVGQEMGEHFVGGFVYYGRTSANGQDVGAFDDRFVRAGADAFVNLQKVIVYGTALYARDDNPLGVGERRSFFGGFAQGDIYLNDRTVALVRLDAVHQQLPAVFAAAESENPLFRVNTIAVTPGVQFLARPNVKLAFEYQVRQTRQEDRALAQLHLSFQEGLVNARTRNPMTVTAVGGALVIASPRRSLKIRRLKIRRLKIRRLDTGTHRAST